MPNSPHYYSKGRLPTGHYPVHPFFHHASPLVDDRSQIDHSTKKGRNTDSEKISGDREIIQNAKGYVRNFIQDFDTLKDRYSPLLPVLSKYAYRLIKELTAILEKQLESMDQHSLKGCIKVLNSFFQIFESYHKQVKPIENIVMILRNTLESHSERSNSDFLNLLTRALAEENKTGKEIKSFLYPIHNKIRKETAYSITLPFKTLKQLYNIENDDSSLENAAQQYNTELYSTLCDMRAIIREIKAQRALYRAQQGYLIPLMEIVNYSKGMKIFRKIEAHQASYRAQQGRLIRLIKGIYHSQNMKVIIRGRIEGEKRLYLARQNYLISLIKDTYHSWNIAIIIGKIEEEQRLYLARQDSLIRLLESAINSEDIAIIIRKLKVQKGLHRAQQDFLRHFIKGVDNLEDMKITISEIEEEQKLYLAQQDSLIRLLGNADKISKLLEEEIPFLRVTQWLQGIFVPAIITNRLVYDDLHQDKLVRSLN